MRISYNAAMRPNAIYGNSGWFYHPFKFGILLENVYRHVELWGLTLIAINLGYLMPRRVGDPIGSDCIQCSITVPPKSVRDPRNCGNDGRLGTLYIRTGRNPLAHGHLCEALPVDMPHFIRPHTGTMYHIHKCIFYYLCYTSLEHVVARWTACSAIKTKREMKLTAYSRNSDTTD